jgi:hypothetical protein
MPYKYSKNAIRIEPRKDYDKALLGRTKDGRLIYSYWKLVEVTIDILYKKNKSEYLSEEETDEAVEWVEYNILGLNDSKESQFKVSYRK